MSRCFIRLICLVYVLTDTKHALNNPEESNPTITRRRSISWIYNTPPAGFTKQPDLTSAKLGGAVHQQTDSTVPVVLIEYMVCCASLFYCVYTKP